MSLMLDPLSAGAGLVGGVLSYIGGQKANKQNVALQRETNALNYQMFQENQGFQKAMFERQLEAQDPSFLRRRLEAAGYNPAALVAGANGMLGTAPSVSPTPNNPAVAPHVNDNVTPALQIAAAGINSVADASNKLEEAKGKAIDNTYKAAQWNTLLDNMAQSGLLTKEQVEQLRWQNLITQHSFDALSKTAERTLFKIDAEGRLADVNARLQQWLLDNKAPQEVKQIKAQIENLAAQSKYFEAQEFAVRAGVPATLASLFAQAHRDKTQGDLNESENDMNSATKKWIGEMTKGNDVGSNIMKLLWLYLRNGRP